MPQLQRVLKVTQNMLIWRSTLGFLCCLSLATTLTSCGKTLDATKIQEDIKADVIRKGATSLKSVYCPKDVKPEVGKTFECIGELDGGNAFAISVKQEDAEGKVQWDVPNAKGILNLEKLQALFLESLKTPKGAPPEINCGGVYRAVKPGDSFDCVVTPKPKSSDQSGKVAKTDSSVKTADLALTPDAKAADPAEKPAATDSALETSKTTGPDKLASEKTADPAKDVDKAKNADKADSAESSNQNDKAAALLKTADKTSKNAKAPAGQLVAIRISVDVEGNITWQQVLEDDVKVAATPTSGAALTTPAGAVPPAVDAAKSDVAVTPDAAAAKAAAVEITTDAGED